MRSSLWLLSLGIYPHHKFLVEHDYTTTPLLNGNVEGMSAYLTDEPYELDMSTFPYKVFDPNNYGIEAFGDIFFTKKNYLNESPEDISNFIKATQEGWKIALDKQERIVNLIIKNYHSNHTKNYLLNEAEMISYYIRPGGFLSTKSNITIAIKDIPKWKNIETIYKRFGLIKKDFDILDHLNGFSGRGIGISEKCSTAVAVPYILITLCLMVILVITERLGHVKIIVKYSKYYYERKTKRTIKFSFESTFWRLYF